MVEIFLKSPNVHFKSFLHTFLPIVSPSGGWTMDMLGHQIKKIASDIENLKQNVHVQGKYIAFYILHYTFLL